MSNAHPFLEAHPFWIREKKCLTLLGKQSLLVAAFSGTPAQANMTEGIPGYIMSPTLHPRQDEQSSRILPARTCRWLPCQWERHWNHPAPETQWRAWSLQPLQGEISLPVHRYWCSAGGSGLEDVPITYRSSVLHIVCNPEKDGFCYSATQFFKHAHAHTNRLHKNLVLHWYYTPKNTNDGLSRFRKVGIGKPKKILAGFSCFVTHSSSNKRGNIFQWPGETFVSGQISHYTVLVSTVLKWIFLGFKPQYPYGCC